MFHVERVSLRKQEMKMITRMVIQLLTLLVPRLGHPCLLIFLLIYLVENLTMFNQAMQIVSAF